MLFPDALFPALPWLLPFATLVRLGRRGPEIADAPAASGRTVSVIIPARNEAATIETVTRSVLATSYRPVEVIVVDDRSTDGTAAIVERLAREDSRLRLIRGEELPDGWYGKPWACVQGYRRASGELLLFTDADTTHHPALLPHAAGALLREQADLVTVAPLQRCVTFWERIIMPQIWLLLGLRYHPRAVNRARRPRDVIANGQFVLVTREGYEAVGTHAAVRHEVAEDLALAQSFVLHRRRIHFAFARTLMETRMYRSLPELIAGWSKNIYLGGRRSFPEEPVLRALVPVMLVLALVFWLIPPAAAVLLAATGAGGSLTTAAFIASIASAAFWMLICYGMAIPAAYGLGYPLGAVMALYIVARSTWRGERRVEWRARTYKNVKSET